MIIEEGRIYQGYVLPAFSRPFKVKSISFWLAFSVNPAITFEMIVSLVYPLHEATIFPISYTYSFLPGKK
jgi:hypothetical protein